MNLTIHYDKNNSTGREECALIVNWFWKILYVYVGELKITTQTHSADIILSIFLIHFKILMSNI